MAELDPITRQEMFLFAAAGESAELPTPITRKEMYLAKAAGEDVEIPEPITREEIYLKAVAEAGGGGGGGDITVESLSVTENGTYTAPGGKAYSPVTVNVPNSYAAGDEGKVVSNGALVAQTAHATVTENGTIDTTLNDSVEVAVPAATLVTKSITQNGTYNASGDSADGYSSVTVNVSGGASNVVTGTFTGTTTGAAMDVNLNYSGSGYPIAFLVCPKEGPYNSESGTFYSLIQRYAISSFAAIKMELDQAPKYQQNSSSSPSTDKAQVMVMYKSSATSASSFTGDTQNARVVFSSTDASSSPVARVASMKNATTLSVYIASTSYGFAANIEYKYWVIYSE